MKFSQEQTPGLISVIMPCFNAEKYLEKAIQSVMEQSYSNVELIAVDDGSTDGTFTKLQQCKGQFENRIHIFKRDNQGPYSARNFALQKAHGEYIAFLDSDDYWDPVFLSSLHAVFSASNADLAYCGWQNFGEHDNKKPYIPPVYEKEDPVAALLKGCPWPIHAAMIKTSVVEILGGFSERSFTSMDYDFWLRALAVTRNIVLVPQVLAFYRWHGSGQISSIKWRQVIDSWDVRIDFIQKNPDLVAHLDRATLDHLTHGYLKEKGYEAFWKRDLVSAHKIFRKLMRTGYWRFKDIPYVFPSLLKENLFAMLVNVLDKRNRGEKST